jgi:hypothetical protein
MALLYGSTEVTVVSDDVLIIHRQYFEEHVWFVINKGAKQVSIDVDMFKLNNISELEEGPAGELFMQLPVKGKLSFVVNPNSFGTLITKK